MTIQVQTCNASKAKLLKALTEQPSAVSFYDPSIVNTRWFNGTDIKPGESFPVVMDHPKRSRFATVTRKESGAFRVE